MEYFENGVMHVCVVLQTVIWCMYSNFLHRYKLLQKVNGNTLHVREMTIKRLSGWLFSNFITFIASFCRDE